MQVDVTVTAKADQPWLWGVQSAVEAIFITQAKDDILSFLEYNVRLFEELHAMQQVSLSYAVYLAITNSQSLATNVWMRMCCLQAQRVEAPGDIIA